MASFEERLSRDAIFKSIVKEFFIIFLKDKAFVKEMEVEGSLSDIHEHIRFKRDLTTEFIRYMPDIFICWHKDIGKDSTLIELKTAFTGFKYNRAKPLKEMRKKIPDLRKEEIVNIELGSFDNILRLNKIGVRAIIWIYASFHLENKWLAVIPESNLNLKSYNTLEMASTIGSGTPIANIFTRINNKNVFKLSEWISKEFSLKEEDVEKFFVEKENLFEKNI